MFRVQDNDVHQCDSGWVPVFVDQDKSISLMSIGFLLEKPDDAVVWRGPKKNALIKQFVADVAWGDLDFLIVDTPPGTSDEHISTVEALRPYKPLGAILVTTPQAVSVGDVRRELTFCKKTGLRVLGIVENMSGFVCPHCSECTNIFSKGGGEELAKHAGVPFLGEWLWSRARCGHQRCPCGAVGVPEQRDAALWGQAGWAPGRWELLLPCQSQDMAFALLPCHPNCSERASGPTGAEAVISSLLWLPTSW
ncbi:cytosolic Fe-S cluster assembly factor NUBP2 isoform 2-T2 [Pterocles gutturalis]